MNINSTGLAAAVLAVAILIVPTDISAQSPPCEIQTRAGGVECTDEDGQTVWEFDHPALWGSLDAFRDDGEAVEPIGPVQIDGAAFYAAARDLFQIDPAEGTVRDRVRFPAPVAAIEVDDEDNLEVTVRDHLEGLDEHDAPREVSIQYTPGSPSPPQYNWSAPRSKDLFLSSRDADWRAAVADDPDEALELLRRARQVDPTNPFFSQEIGELLRQEGDQEAARRAFERAVEAPDAVWRDLLAVSSRLEEADAPDQADRAFQRGLELMREAGIDNERLTTMVSVATSLMLPTDDDSSIARAIQSADPEQVDRLVGRFARLAPYVESGHYNWETLANWMLDQGEEDLAAKWNQIADENRDYATGIFTRNVVHVDRALLALVSISIALAILAVLIGMRGGLARRRLHDRSDGEGHNLWIPRIRLRALVVPAGLFVAVVAIPFYLATHLSVVDRLSDAPLAVAQDGLASPASIEWLDSLTGGSAVDDLLNQAVTEQQALERGEPMPEKEPIAHDIARVLYEDARHQQIELLRQGRMPDLVAFVRTAGDQPDQLDQPPSTSLAVMVIPLLALGLLVLMGGVIGARAPQIARPVLLLVPGGSARLAPVGALALAAALTALGALAGLDSAVYEAAQPAFLEYFGLQDLGEHTPSHSRLWAWMTLGVVAVYQSAIVTWEVCSPD